MQAQGIEKPLIPANPKGRTRKFPGWHPRKIKEVSICAITRVERKRILIRIIEKGNYTTMSKYIEDGEELLAVIEKRVAAK
jgi:hypothetical protein